MSEIITQGILAIIITLIICTFIILVYLIKKRVDSKVNQSVVGGLDFKERKQRDSSPEG